ncbi:hypothetical protein [Nocardia tengchongensis]|uniref:hypothetical protein n=1 Tax=Nocardia tengchongensis TaxID=2055889 RepID=UPI003665B072
MRKGRIGLALSAFAAVVVSLSGSPLAAAEITDLSVHLDYPGDLDPWYVEAWVTCDPAANPTTVPVSFTDNGKPLTLSRGTGSCSYGKTDTQVVFKPTSVGTHHIVATQYKPDGSVLSTMSKDVNVTELPSNCGPSASGGSSSLCRLFTGSAGN